MSACTKGSRITMLSCIFDLSLGRDILTGLFMCLYYSPITPFGQSPSDRKFRRRFISFWFFAKKGKFLFREDEVSFRWKFFLLRKKKIVFCFRFEKKYLNLLFWSADIQMTERKWLLAEWRGPRHLEFSVFVRSTGFETGFGIIFVTKKSHPTLSEL